MVSSETIRKIIESNLLATSPSQLASELGYAGRTSINRLRGETAGEEALHEFCKRVGDVFGLRVEDMETLGRIKGLTEEFAVHMMKEFGEISDSIKYKIIFSFIEEDYEIFSEGYRQLELNKWLLMKGHEPEIFFLILTLFLMSDKSRSF